MRIGVAGPQLSSTVSSHMIAVILAVAVSFVVAGGGAWLDQRNLRCATPIRLAVALALLATSAWMVSVITLALWLQVPGAYGPVQYWYNAPEADGFMDVRGFALKLFVFAIQPLAAVTALATLISLFLKSATPRWRRCVVPVISLLVCALAHYMFMEYEFFPSA